MIRKHFVISSLLMTFVIAAFSQVSRKDSVLNALRNVQGNENKAELLLRLGQSFQGVNPDSSFYYKQEALKLAETTGNNKGFIKAWMVQWVECAQRLGPEEALKRCFQTDSLIEIELNKATGNYLSELKRYKVMNTSYTGSVYGGLDNTDKSLEYHLKAIANFSLIPDKNFQATVLFKIANIYSEKSAFPKALEVLFKTLKIREEINDKPGIATTYNKLGSVYYFIKERAKAKEYYSRAMKLWEELGNYSEVATGLVNLGIIYRDEGDDEKGMECLLKALAHFEKTGDKNLIALTMMNIGAQYKDEGDSAIFRGDRDLALKDKFPKALSFFLKSNVLLKELNSRQAICVCEGNIGSTYYSLGQYDLSEKYLMQSLQLAKEIGSIDDIKSAHQYLYELYSQKKQPQKALENYKLYIQYRDSIENTETTKAALQQELKFSFEKKAAADSVKTAEEKKLITVQLKQEKTQRFALYGGLALVMFFAVFMFNRFKVTQKQKAVIEIKEKETQHQKELIEEKQKEILDSITYAKRIQQALLASDGLLSSGIPEYFIFFKPKDIVSGDFYWASHVGGKGNDNDLFYIAACDSTGHGVPGAFMSLLNISFLNEAVTEKGIKEPNEILDHARRRLISALKADGSEEGGKDGMDCTLLQFNFKAGIMKYSAANNDFYLIREKQLYVYKADKMPVGKSPRDEEPFTLKEVELKKGDLIYLFTDGMADQFGGPKGKKFKYKQLEELLIENSSIKMSDQKELIATRLENWKGSLEQVDDICIIGIKV